MPGRLAKPCNYPGCGVLVHDGTSRCAKHPRAERTASAAHVAPTKRIRGRKHQELRSRFLRNNPLCSGPDSQCQREGRTTEATVRDHRIPLAEGGTESPDNEQALCRDCHDIKSRGETLRGIYREFDPARPMSLEAAGRQMPDDLAPSRIPLTIVCGPPGAGKRTYVADHYSNGDVVIDLRRIVTSMSGLTEHQAVDARWVSLALGARNDLLRSLATDTLHKRAWFVLGEPSAARLATWSRRLAGTIVMLDVPLPVCIDRLRRNGTEGAQLARAIANAQRWFAIAGEQPDRRA
jgi:5-methylcytosine-specific restriction protein A